MKHKFEYVAILCKTDEQVQHLATMVTTHGLESINFGKYFREAAGGGSYSNYGNALDRPVVSYEEFIAGMQETETQVVEVAECERCPLVDSYDEYVLCNHPTPSNTQTTSLIEKFSTCPLKKGAVTIKLKEQWQKK